jgi:hypothetical protein
MSQMAGDAEQLGKMLRCWQILDNLLLFIVAGRLMNQFKSTNLGPSFNKTLKFNRFKTTVRTCGRQFICDVFAQSKIADDITKEIGNVTYNVDKSLSSLTDAQCKRTVAPTIHHFSS